MELTVDRYAAPRRVDWEAANAAELLMDSAKLDMMRILKCDEKYNNGTASDFEMLSEWNRLLPLCRGTGAASLFEKECQALGISASMDPREQWRRMRAPSAKGIRLADDQITLHQFVLNFIDQNRKSSVRHADLITELLGRIDAMKIEPFHLILRLPNVEFSRPDPYNTEQIFAAFINDEKYKKEQEMILLCGTLIALLRALPNEKKAVLHLYAEHSYGGVFVFLDYLREHRLFDGSCYVGIFPDTATSVYADFCHRSYVSPELILAVPDFAPGLSDRLAHLFRTYPHASVSFGGVLTDSPLYMVAHEMVRACMPLEIKKQLL